MRDLGLPWAMTAAGLHHHLGLRTTGLVSNDNTELLRCTSAPHHRTDTTIKKSLKEVAA